MCGGQNPRLIDQSWAANIEVLRFFQYCCLKLPTLINPITLMFVSFKSYMPWPLRELRLTLLARVKAFSATLDPVDQWKVSMGSVDQSETSIYLEKQTGRVRGGQPPLAKEGQVRLNPWLHLRGGGVTGAGVTSSLQSGAEEITSQIVVIKCLNSSSSFIQEH